MRHPQPGAVQLTKLRSWAQKLGIAVLSVSGLTVDEIEHMFDTHSTGSSRCGRIFSAAPRSSTPAGAAEKSTDPRRRGEASPRAGAAAARLPPAAHETL